MAKDAEYLPVLNVGATWFSSCGARDVVVPLTTELAETCVFDPGNGTSLLISGVVIVAGGRAAAISINVPVPALLTPAAAGLVMVTVVVASLAFLCFFTFGAFSASLSNV